MSVQRIMANYKDQDYISEVYDTASERKLTRVTSRDGQPDGRPEAPCPLVVTSPRAAPTCHLASKASPVGIKPKSTENVGGQASPNALDFEDATD